MTQYDLIIIGAGPAILIGKSIQIHFVHVIFLHLPVIFSSAIASDICLGLIQYAA